MVTRRASWRPSLRRRAPPGRQLVLGKRASREQWLGTVISARLSREEQQVLKQAVRLLERLAEE